MRLVYAKRVQKDFRKLSSELQQRIINKMSFYAEQSDPLQFAQILVNNPYGDVRFRVGQYRVICEIADDVIYVTVVGHRGEIYR